MFAKNTTHVKVCASLVSFREAVTSLCPGVGDIKPDHSAQVVIAIFSIVEGVFSSVFESVTARG